MVPDAASTLTAAIAAGDERAVDAFFRGYFDWLLAEARRATGRDESFCLDVVQDVVLKVMRNVRRVESEGQLRVWLRLVVQTVAVDRLRADARRNRRERVRQQVAADEGQAAAAARQVEWLRGEIARLDPRLAELLRLRFGEGRTLRQIAGALGVSIGTVDGRLRRTLARLRERGDRT